MDREIPKNIGNFLGRFAQFMPIDRRVRMTFQAFITNILEIDETLEKDSIKCSGSTIFLNMNPYLKKEIINHSGEILTLLREKDHLFFTRMQ